MKIELEKDLVLSSPIFCQSYTKDALSGKGFNFECGDGWYWPLKKCFTRIEMVNKKVRRYGFEFFCVELKEKYGRCNIKYFVHDKKIVGLLDFIGVKDIRSLKGRFYAGINHFIVELVNILIEKINGLFIRNTAVVMDAKEEYTHVVNTIIKECEDDCWNVCESCGVSNTDENPLVVRRGYIMRFCSSCSDEWFNKNGV